MDALKHMTGSVIKTVKHAFGYKTEKESFINILLLGETGIGKSTFVNAFANYLVSKSFERAEKGRLLVLKPTTITDGRRQIEIGKKDSNEFEETGASATQDVKTYLFPIGDSKIKLRLIDTPGLADTRGIEQDEINCELILDYISTLEDLHAFCLVMRPNTTRITAQFEYCIKQILTRLEKSAAKNIIFVITNTRGSDFKGGDTMPSLKKFVGGIKKRPPYVEIPLNENRNVFYFENDCFHYLAAQQHGISQRQINKQQAKFSWNRSAEQAWKLMQYISDGVQKGFLPPHKVQNTVSINEARRLIIQLSQPLADITQTIADNIDLLTSHEEKLRSENQSLEELKSNLYIPGMKLETIEIEQPITVCTHLECVQVIKIESKEKYHYTQKCHDPCYLENVPREIIGDKALRNCWAMNGTEYCRLCRCHFSKHMHVYYLTKPTSSQLRDQNVVDTISTKEKALQEVENIIKDMQKRKQEFEEEHQTIINITAQFVHFLQNNAITPFDDSYKTYINYLIHRQKSRGKDQDKKEVANLQSLLSRHEAAKAAFDKTLSQIRATRGSDSVFRTVTAEDILDSIQILFSLKHNGPKIKEIYDKQKNCRQKEYKGMNSAYEYTSIIKDDDWVNVARTQPLPDSENSSEEDESEATWLYINF